MIRRPPFAVLLPAVLAFSSSAVFAQQPPDAAPRQGPPQPPRAQPARTGADEVPRAELSAKVVEVTGDVRRAPTGTSPLDADAWRPVKAGEELPPGTLIRTGIRSDCLLLFGDDTVINVKRLTLASISDVYRTETEKTVRLGLGYGAIRGGTSEGALRSNVIIDSTVATLAKRGTEGFEMEVEPYTGRFTISLAREGLVEALQKRTGQRKLVRPGEYANELNIASLWIKQDRFDRTVKFAATESFSAADLDFTTANPTGRSVVSPGGGTEVAAFTPSASRAFVTDRVVDQLGTDTSAFSGLDLLVVEQPLVRRPEGNFGVGNTVRLLLPRSRIGTAAPRLLPERVSQGDVDRWSRSRARLRHR